MGGRPPRAVIIASGGQGADEAVSEAEAMRTYLVEERGVPADAVIEEDRSTTTNVFASRNTTSATVPNGMAAKPMSTSHGSSNWMDSPYSANRHSSRKYSALRNCRGSLR